MAEVINLTIDEAMDAVFAEFGATELDPETEFTERQLAERNNLPNQSAHKMLGDALKSGKVTRRPARHGGRRVWAYRYALSANVETTGNNRE